MSSFPLSSLTVISNISKSVEKEREIAGNQKEKENYLFMYQ